MDRVRHEGHVRVVVAYDVADDGRRRRVAEALLDFTARAEYSVFDGWLPEDQVGDVWRAVRASLRPSADAAFSLVLCQACAECADGLGRAEAPDPPGTNWIV